LVIIGGAGAGGGALSETVKPIAKLNELHLPLRTDWARLCHLHIYVFLCAMFKAHNE
jgi:hypothetical protein